jgi:hypothetical protein
LALAITGVSVYDFNFFRDHETQTPAAILREPVKPAQGVEPVVAPSTEIQTTDSSSKEGMPDFLPAISREELQRKAQHAFVLGESPISEVANSWPSRDPFSLYKKPEPARSNSMKLAPTTAETTSSVNLPEPQCVLSGTMIDQNSRLALIDGMPLSVGARIGAWQLAHIESDYIILQAGERTHRIELTSGGRPPAKKEPS